MLHPVFARFRAALEQPLPDTTDASVALQVAFNLCIEMADAFEDEPSRRNAFESHLKPLFTGSVFRHEVPVESPQLERHSSRADLLLVHNYKPVLAGENKVEWGTGDAYMQLSRVYQTWVNKLREEETPELSHGAPMVLICVMG